MKLETNYLELAQEIRNELTENTDTIIGKQSKYNNNKFFSFSHSFSSRLFHLQTNGHSDEQSSS